MASTTGLARTRSIRKPAVKDDETPQGKPVQGRGETRNASPSRLPMKPPTRSATISTAAPSSTTRTTATTTTTTTQSRARAPTGPAARKISGNTSTRTSSKSVDHGAPGAVKPLGRAPSIRQAKTATATAMAPPPAPITRSGSTARPRSSEGGRPAAAAAAARERILGHSRAKSTATALTAATTLRPPTHAPSRSNPSPAPSTSSSASATTQTTAASSSTATTTTRAQTRSQTHQQHARVASQSQPAAAGAAAPRRPAFNTNQQHYSPARTHAPKALTSTFLAPPSPSKRPANVAATAETSRLQTELLQLSLLHREAPAAAAAWHASARHKLGARFAGLSEAEQALRAAERDAAEARALCDLVRWADARPQQQPTTASSSSSSSLENTATRDGKKKKTKKSADGDGDGGGGPPLPLDQKIQLLDQVLNGAWALGGPGGRYQRAVRGFEAWLGAVARIRAAQRSGDVDGLLAPHHCDGNGEDGYGNGNGNGDRDREEIAFFVSDLDADPWRRDHAGLVRVLEGWRRTLAQLGDVIVAEHDDDDDDNNDNDNNDDRKKNNKSAVAAAKRGARNGGGRKANGGGQPAGNGDGNGVLPTTAAGAPGSSHPGGLARTLRGCRGLVDGMLAELGAMERIERDALAVEEEWMEQMEAQLRADEEDDARRCRARAEDVPPWKLLVS